jgi:hypothetical protein
MSSKTRGVGEGLCGRARPSSAEEPARHNSSRDCHAGGQTRPGHCGVWARTSWRCCSEKPGGHLSRAV